MACAILTGHQGGAHVTRKIFDGVLVIETGRTLEPGKIFSSGDAPRRNRWQKFLDLPEQAPRSGRGSQANTRRGVLEGRIATLSPAPRA